MVETTKASLFFFFCMNVLWLFKPKSISCKCDHCLSWHNLQTAGPTEYSGEVYYYCFIRVANASVRYILRCIWHVCPEIRLHYRMFLKSYILYFSIICPSLNLCSLKQNACYLTILKGSWSAFCVHAQKYNLSVVRWKGVGAITKDKNN